MRRDGGAFLVGVCVGAGGSQGTVFRGDAKDGLRDAGAPSCCGGLRWWEIDGADTPHMECADYAAMGGYVALRGGMTR